MQATINTKEIVRDPVIVSALEAWIAFDNMSTFAKIGWHLKDSNGAIVRSGSVGIEGDDYLNWTGDNETAMQVAAIAAGVELPLPPEEPAPTVEPEAV